MLAPGHRASGKLLSLQAAVPLPPTEPSTAVASRTSVYSLGFEKLLESDTGGAADPASVATAA